VSFLAAVEKPDRPNLVQAIFMLHQQEKAAGQ
jgi:hypothetical protein